MSTLLIKILRIFIPPLISSGILVVPAPRSARCRSAQSPPPGSSAPSFQIGQRQVLDRAVASPATKSTRQRHGSPRQQNGKQGHNGQRLARGCPRPPPIALAEAKATTTVVPKSMAAKKDMMTMLKLSASPTRPWPFPSQLTRKVLNTPSAAHRHFPAEWAQREG